jgi:hypothetical protein
MKEKLKLTEGILIFGRRDESAITIKIEGEFSEVINYLQENDIDKHIILTCGNLKLISKQNLENFCPLTTPKIHRGFTSYDELMANDKLDYYIGLSALQEIEFVCCYKLTGCYGLFELPPDMEDFYQLHKKGYPKLCEYLEESIGGSTNLAAIVRQAARKLKNRK